MIALGQRAGIRNKYIVKPIWEDGSMGITSDSVFEYIPGLETNDRIEELDNLPGGPHKFLIYYYHLLHYILNK